MRVLLLLAIVALGVVVPLLSTAPHAEACRPYTYYCPIDGQYHYGCGNQVPSSCVLALVRP